MSTKSVYIFGPIYLFGSDYLPVYKELNQLAAKYFKRVIGTYTDFWDSKESPEDFYKRTYETITKCDLFVAEVSSPSHGVGMELQMAKEHNIPIIAVAKGEISKSTMVLGLPNLKKMIAYESLKDLKEKLETEFKLFTKQT